MNIVVLSGSPRKGANTDTMVEAFAETAREGGHTVEVIRVASKKIAGCLGCQYCFAHKGVCVQKDDMAALRDKLLETDMLVFVTPLYYFGMSAQLKMVIDRFYSFTGKLSSRKLKTALIAAAWDSNDWTMQDLSAHYQTLCRYMNFQDQGMILGTGCGSVSMTKRSPFLNQAYELGKSLKG